MGAELWLSEQGKLTISSHGDATSFSLTKEQAKELAKSLTNLSKGKEYHAV